MPLRSLVSVALLLLLASPALARPEPLTARELQTGLAEYNRYAHGRLPNFSADELEELLQGEVVRRKLRGRPGHSHDRVLGVVLTRQPRVQPWLVVTDSHFASDKDFAGKKLDPPGANPTRSYGFIDLPWPVADRHWVVDVTTNVELAEKTKGRCWERYWDLTTGGEVLEAEVYVKDGLPGTDPAKLSEMIYTPVNSGSWIFIQLPKGMTLLAYQLATQVGGDIPDEALATFTVQALGRLLGSILDRAEKVPTHYDAAHPALPGGDGLPLPKLTP